MKSFQLYSIIAIICVLALFGGYFLLNKSTPPPAKTNEVIFYYGDTCPHCKNVEDFLSKNKNIEAKIPLIKKEVYENKTNAQDLENKALVCGMDISQGVGVPFLYYKGQCIVGDTPVINFLTEKAK